MMTVVDERNKWRESFENWSCSQTVEMMCEYILYLENR